MNEEVAALWNVSSKFQETSFKRTIVSTFETLPTRYHSGSFLPRRRKVLVDKDLATTSLQHEELIGVNLSHTEICSVLEGSDINEKIAKLAKDAAMSLENLNSHTDETGPLPKAIQPDRSPETSLQVSLGSEDLSDYEILPTKGGPILQTLDEILLPPPADSVSSSQTNHPRSFALCGPGGIGKTQIAVEFVMTRKKAFDAVFWVHSDSEIKISGDYTLIAAKLGLMHELDEGNAVVSRDRLIEWLNRPSKHGRCVNNEDSEYLESAASWLLVFDNADNPEILAEYWPVTGRGAILVTSRDPMAKTHFFLTSGVDLEPFDRELAATFLQALTGYQAEDDHKEALVLTDRLGGLPLALAQFASVLQRQDLSFAEFLEAYNDPLFLADVHSTVVSGLREKNKRALFSVWQFENLSLAAQKLLDLIAMADPDAIPEVIFLHPELTHLSIHFPTSLREFESARTGLLRCSLVRRLKNDKAIRIHRVIRDSAQARMTPERFSLAFKAFSELLYAICLLKLGWDHAADLVNRNGPNGTAAESEHLRSLFHAVVAVRAREEHELVPAVSVCFCAGGMARYHCEENIRLCLLHHDEFNLATAYTEIGVHFLTANRHEEALDALKRSIDIQAALLQRETDAAVITSGLYMATFPKCYSGYALLGLGRANDAEEYLVPLLDPGFLMLTLGNVRAAQNRMDESFELHELALQQYRSTIGNSHPHTGGAMLKVSDHYYGLGNFDSADALLDEALKVWSTRSYFRPERAWTLYKKSCIKWNEDLQMAQDLRSNAESLLVTFMKDMKLTVPTKPCGEADYRANVAFFFT
ncbi:Tetratricopeptide-like helical [Penicillium italicum]|uniref:Tetratricopeptide-like helical n=1 Tax=Penicillium italicum TaxID=40296 RepID=A0A0A2KN16_PENIT|nr:Tetratricopeptide-like helical [Penicillium italicum]